MDLVGSKLRKKMGSTIQESSSAPVSSFAKKQLERMGWSEGTGLGKKRDGIKTHIRAKKRTEQTGLGAEKAKSETINDAGEWWKDSVGSTLAKLSKKKGGSSKKRKRECTDEDLFEATGGVRFGMRAAPIKNLAKWNRTNDNSKGNPETKPEQTVGHDAEEKKKRKTKKKDREKKSKKDKKKKAKKIEREEED